MAEKDSPGDGRDEEDVGRVVVAAWTPRQFDSDTAADEFPLVGSRNANRVRRTHAMLTGTYIEAESYYGEALAAHGLPPDFWLPVDLAINWKSDGYPRYRTRESYQQWVELQREALGFKKLSSTTPGFVPGMLADWEHDRALIARFDLSLAELPDAPTTDRSADGAYEVSIDTSSTMLSNRENQEEPAEAASDTSTPTKAKRSTQRGEGRAKLIAALTKHHQYADDGCLNPEPIGNNELARLAGVDQATASAFFKQQFMGHGKYKAACADAGLLAAALKLLNGEFAPHFLYGGKPADEDERDEE